jgi:hypothetical protein
MNIRHAITMISSCYTKGYEHLHYQGVKVKAMYLHNPAFLLNSTVPVFHTMMYGHYIGCQHMGILFAPSVMLNIVRREEAEFNHY